MKIAVSDRKDDIVTVNIETEEGFAKERFKKAAKDISKRVNIPGFRQGKAPFGMVVDYVGEDYVKAQTLTQEYIVRIINEAIKKEKLDVVDIDSIDKLEMPTPEAAVSIEAKLTLYPEVELGDYKNLEVEVEIDELDEADALEKALENIQKNLTSFEEAEEGAKIAMGDEIVLDFKGSVNIGTDEEPNWEEREAMKAEGYQVAVEPGRFIDDFLEQTVGLKVGAEKTIEVRFPKEYHAEDLQDKPAKFEIKINKISKAQKPALDDELAKKNKNPEAESLEDLKAKLSEKIKEEYENHKKALTENAIFEKLAEESKFEIPDDLVEKTMDVEYAKMAQMYGIDVEQIKQLMQAQGADPTKEKEMTKVRLANTLLLNGIMKAENFQHSDAETDEAWVEAQRNINNKSLNKSDFTYEIDVQLSTKKAKDLLINETKVSYVEKKPVAAEDETTEEVKEEAKA